MGTVAERFLSPKRPCFQRTATPLFRGSSVGSSMTVSKSDKSSRIVGTARARRDSSDSRSSRSDGINCRGHLPRFSTLFSRILVQVGLRAANSRKRSRRFAVMLSPGSSFSVLKRSRVHLCLSFPGFRSPRHRSGSKSGAIPELLNDLVQHHRTIRARRRSLRHPRSPESLSQSSPVATRATRSPAIRHPVTWWAWVVSQPPVPSPLPLVCYRHLSSSAKGWTGPVSLGFGNALSACSARRKSSFVVIFRLMGEPGTRATAWPSRSTNWASSVAAKPSRRA